MRQQAFENLLKMMIEVNKSDEAPGVKLAYFKNLCAKGEILINRTNDASVIRELINGRH